MSPEEDIIFWEPCCIEWEHSQFNSFLFRTVSSAYAVQAACSLPHLKIISKGTEADVDHVLDPFERGHFEPRARVPRWRRLLPLARQTQRILGLLRQAHCETVLVSSTDFMTLFFIAALALRSRRTRFFVVLHGVVAQLASNNWRRLLFRGLSVFLRGNVTLITFFEAQNDLIQGAMMGSGCRVAIAPHPLFDSCLSGEDTPARKESLPGHGPITMVIPGAYAERKMVVPRATYDPGPAEGLRITQVASGEVPSDARVPLQMVELKKVGDDSEYRRELLSADAILFLGSPSFYQYALSGVAWDAFSMGKPLVAVSNAFLEELCRRYDLPVLCFEDYGALLQGLTGGEVVNWLSQLRREDLSAMFSGFRSDLEEAHLAELWLDLLADPSPA